VTRRELLRHPGLLGLVARDALLGLQSVAVVAFTAAGLRERARLRPVASEAV
jgi:hypothetical protein